ncbi:hypothetical protein, partial [Enterobacter hormaechei]|uniref:P-type ATPase n=1 Tax=Enterobacter hormaechei TaxID=158836 RepID=UPI001F0A9563
SVSWLLIRFMLVNALLELSNICLMGTNVASGTATAVVVATGGRTYFGSLAKSIVGSRAQTAFDRGVNSVSWLLIRFMLVNALLELSNICLMGTNVASGT